MSVPRSHHSVCSTATDFPVSDETKTIRKLRKHFLARGANGVPVLAPSYLMLERDVSAYIERVKRQPAGVGNVGASCCGGMSVWDMKRLIRKADLPSLSDAELDLWIRTRVVVGSDAAQQNAAPDGGDAVDAVSLLVDLRLELHCTQQQVDDIVRKLRCNRNGSRSSGSGAAATMTMMDRVDAVLTLPEKFFLLHYLENDEEYLEDLLADEIPIDIVYPCLINKLLDAVIVVDGGKAHTGTIGLLKCFRFAEYADQPTFKRVMKEYACGLLDGEIDLLFGFLVEDQQQVISVARFIGVIRDKIQTIAFASEEENVRRIQSKVRSLLKRTANPFPMVTLHNEMYPALSRAAEEAEESDFNVMLKFTDLLRSHGVITASVPDIDVELLWLYIQEARVGIMGGLCGDTPPVREDAISHALSVLASCASQYGPLSVSTIASVFRTPPRYPGSMAADIVTFFRVYNSTRDVDQSDPPRDAISDAAFRSYWEAISFSVDADTEFNMLLWNSLQLSKFKPGGGKK
eukprot:PhM_4_TR3548/c0_g1_i1/m.76492